MLAEPVPFQSAVARLVELARSEGIVLRTGEAAKQIRSENPECKLAGRQIAELVARKAISAGVPIQFTDPD